MDKHLYAFFIALAFLTFSVGVKQWVGAWTSRREPLLESLTWFGVDLASMAFAILLGSFPSLDVHSVHLPRLGCVVAYCAISFTATCIAYAAQKGGKKTASRSTLRNFMRPYLPIGVAWFFGMSPFVMVLPVLTP